MSLIWSVSKTGYCSIKGWHISSLHKQWFTDIPCKGGTYVHYTNNNQCDLLIFHIRMIRMSMLSWHMSACSVSWTGKRDLHKKGKGQNKKGTRQVRQRVYDATRRGNLISEECTAINSLRAARRQLNSAFYN